MGCSNSSTTVSNTPTKEKHISKHNYHRDSNDVRALVEEKILVYNSTEVISDNFEFISLHSKGAYGVLYKVRDKKTNDFKLLKIVSKDYIKYLDNSKTFLQEIFVLTNLDSPYIIKILGCYESQNHYYLVKEYVEGQPLYDAIVKLQSFCESNAAVIMFQLFSAVNYFHSMGLIHRDLKPESILIRMDSKTMEYNIKISDFGIAIFGENSNDLNAVEMSPYFMAPEVIQGKYTNKCDIWSCGVIMYILLCGYPPFKADTDIQTELLVSSGNYSFDNITWDNISEEAKDLLIKLLEYDATKRISAEEALKHIWIQKYSKSKTSNIIARDTFKNLKRLNAFEKFQKATISLIVHQAFLRGEMERNLRKTFEEIDTNHSGFLSYDEIERAFKKYSKDSLFSKENFGKIMGSFRTENTNAISYEDFIHATINLEIIFTEDNLELAFKVFDEEATGFLSKDDLRRVLGFKSKGLKEEEDYLNKIMKEIDSSGDGKISLEEFKEAMYKVLRDFKKG